MTLTSGTRLGPYEVVAKLGEGGMGEVYRAKDTKLNRDVAIKVLPELFAQDADRLARFTREAQTLASLNHPNIAHIHGIEESSGRRALVMELVEGEDLSEIIARTAGAGGRLPHSNGASVSERWQAAGTASSPRGGGAPRAGSDAHRGMSLDDALPIAKQIADALEAAHEQGIIHRDLKPANIKVRADGTVKVLDFGLAKAMDPAGASTADPMHSPTLTMRATQMGMVLGTAAYMAPEQAKGKSVDKRADIWAFGVVLYEMLTGRHLFDAEDISETLAAVLTRDVSATSWPSTIPPRLRALIRDCLIRDPKQRLRDIGDARLVLEKIIAGATDDATVPAAASAPVVGSSRARIPWALAALATFVAAAATVWALRPIPASPETRLEITTPAADDPVSFAISPDGRQIVFVGSATGGQSQLWLRPLDETTPRALAGTEGAAYPFWSPDSRSVAFFVAGQLKRLDIGSGLPQTLLGAVQSRGGSWSAAGLLLGQVNGQLIRIPATGGVPADVTKLAPGENSHRWPHFLPDGRRFLFYGLGTSRGLYLGSLDSPESRQIAVTDTNAQFVAPDWLLFLRQGTLLAQHVDLVRGELTGEPVSVADQVVGDSTLTVGAFSVSSGGLIAYRTGRSLVSQLTWFDRSGEVIGKVGTPDGNIIIQPMLSPDGRRVAAYRMTQGNTDVWLFDAGRETRLTFDPGRELYPLWSPDGRRIAFSKDIKGQLNLYQKSSLGGGPEELLLASPGTPLAPLAWSPDGRHLIYTDRTGVTAGDLWVLPLDGKEQPSVFANSKFEERNPQFSPDGRWVAYASDESGRYEVYLRPFPASSGQFPVSTTGGMAPRWRHDGKELYYLAPDSTLMAVAVATAGGAPEMGAPVALFQPRILYGGTLPIGIAFQYDVAPDGRFLINVSGGDADTAPITVIQHWNPGRK